MVPSLGAAPEWCLQRGGEMGARMRAFDWSRTPMGPPARWPRPLKDALALCLRSRFPIAILWGRERLTMLYNDAFIPLLGPARHPAALGMSGRECWREVWPTVGPMIESVLETGEATWSQDLMLPLERRLPREECYFTLSHGAIPGREVPAAGVFCICTETTESVVEERRLRMLRELGSGALLASTESDAAEAAAETLAAGRADVPFALLYLADREWRLARLAALSGLERGSPATPDTIDLQAPDRDPWRLREMLSGGKPLLIEHLEERFGETLRSTFAGAVAPRCALVLPLSVAGKPLGFLVAAVNPRRLLDDPYRAFFGLVAGHIATGIAAARAIEEERRRVCALVERVRRAHEREREDFHTLFIQAPNVYLILRGPDHVVELANPAACHALHRGLEELLDRPLLAAVPELQGTTLAPTLEQVMRTGVPYQGKEVFSAVHWRGETEPREEYYNYVFCPLRSAAGVVEGVLIDAFSVTEEVIARQEMARLRAEAEAANRMKDEFLAMLGHELRNPLAPMVMALQVMRLRGLASREQDILERQVSHLGRLVDDLLDVARITRGKIELRRRPLEISEIITSAIETLTPLLTEQRHRLEIDAPATGLAVLADPERLAQVFLNLLTNAAKYSEAGSRILVQARRRGERVEVCVRDEGIGIAPEMLEKVFDIFVQQPQTLARSAGGLGLGLAIVRSLIEMHEGTVRARSAGPGRGSEFIIDLPALDPQQAAAAGAQQSWSSLVPGSGSPQH